MKKRLFIAVFLFFSFTSPHCLSAAPVKNVILFIGDGMGQGQMEIARLMEYGKEGSLFIETLPYTALVHTYSANEMVTDSAAAGTALATGIKTNNGMIAVNPHGDEVESLLDAFEQAKKKTGIISTNAITDATPAAFSASVRNRWENQRAIARQQLDHEVDVILGGGRQYYGSELIETAKDKGYQFIEKKEDLNQLKEGKTLGLFSEKHFNFKLDLKEHSPQPSLKEMTAKAIDLLDNENGFFLLVEGARIDHASHSGDIPSLWKEIIDLDEAVQYAQEWMKDQPNTLIVVVADHETMGHSATEPMRLKKFKEIKHSTHYMAEKLKEQTANGDYSVDSIRFILETYANMNVSTTKMAALAERLNHAKSHVYTEFKLDWEIGSFIAEQHLAGISAKEIRSKSTTGGHTSNPVVLFADGEGAHVFHGVLDNTDIPKIIAKIAGVRLNEK